MDIIVATDGSLRSTRDEQIMLCGGGPYDGPVDLMSSYRSELSGIVAGLATLGTLFRSGHINIRSVQFLCDNKSAVFAAKRPITDSIFFNTKGDWELIAMVHDLLDNLCSGSKDMRIC
jgi:hypothetical protein